MRKKYPTDNPEYMAAVQKKHRQEHPEAVKKVRRRHHLKKRYGLTLDQYEALLKAQGGKCAVCLQPPGKFRLCVDHGHEYGTVRGLLCTNCNTALGLLKESKERITNMLEYIKSHTDL